MLNGLTHYVNLLTNKINNHLDFEIIYIRPITKSVAMGEGVFETDTGARFPIVALEEKTDEYGFLYYDGLPKILEEEKPKIIMLAETHLHHLLYNEQLQQIIKNNGIKLALKSIPFMLGTYQEELQRLIEKQNKNELPAFNSFPPFVSKIFTKLGVNRLYKKLVLDKKALSGFYNQLQQKKVLYNAVDGHLNYIEKGKEIYGSYGVPAEKIFVTYNSPDTDTYFAVKEKISKEPPILEFNPNRIIHLSRLVEWKRVDMLIKAVANLKNQYPNIELLIIGNGPEEIRLKQMAEDLKVTDSIKFLGGIYDAELFGKYIMSASVYVLAGMGGLSINDAMIFGLPVICSVCDGTEKYLVREGSNGLFFEEGNQQNLESKIAYLFNHPKIRIAMGKNSEKIIKEEINIDTVVDRYVHAFKTIASR